MNGRRRVLDVGCGVGAKYPLLRRRGSYFGVDTDLVSLGRSRRLHPDGLFVASRASRLPFRDAAFREAHLYDVLEHLSERAEAVAEVARVVESGGLVVVESPHWRSEERMMKLLPTYMDEVGHQAVLREEDVVRLTRSWFRLHRTRLKHGVQNALMAHYARGGGHITGQAGVFSNDNRILDLLTNLCSEDLFFLRIFGRVPLWWFVPLWVITLPVGWVVSQLWPKTVRYELRRLARPHGPQQDPVAEGGRRP